MPVPISVVHGKDTTNMPDMQGKLAKVINSHRAERQVVSVTTYVSTSYAVHNFIAIRLTRIETCRTFVVVSRFSVPIVCQNETATGGAGRGLLKKTLIFA